VIAVAIVAAYIVGNIDIEIVTLVLGFYFISRHEHEANGD
jgi:hypothetical protein